MLEVFDAHESVEVLSAHLSWPNLKKGLVGLKSWCESKQKVGTTAWYQPLKNTLFRSAAAKPVRKVGPSKITLPRDESMLQAVPHSTSNSNSKPLGHIFDLAVREDALTQLVCSRFRTTLVMGQINSYLTAVETLFVHLDTRIAPPSSAGSCLFQIPVPTYMERQ